MLKALHHPNIVSYHDTFTCADSGRQAIVMEFCEGGDLDRLLKSRQGKPLGEDELMLLFVQVRSLERGMMTHLHAMMQRSACFLNHGQLV